MKRREFLAAVGGTTALAAGAGNIDEVVDIEEHLSREIEVEDSELVERLYLESGELSVEYSESHLLDQSTSASGELYRAGELLDESPVDGPMEQYELEDEGVYTHIITDENSADLRIVFELENYSGDTGIVENTVSVV